MPVISGDRGSQISVSSRSAKVKPCLYKQTYQQTKESYISLGKVFKSRTQEAETGKFVFKATLVYIYNTQQYTDKPYLKIKQSPLRELACLVPE